MGQVGRAPGRPAWAALLTALVAATLVLGGGAVAFAHPDGDPSRDQQWNLDRIRVDEAWRVTRGAGAVVAVVDTGVALDHPDLHGRFVTRADGTVVGTDLVDGDADPSDEHGHGTLVAGVIAATADDGRGTAGVAPEASILPVRVLGADGSGNSADVGRGIRWAVDHGADVVNVSLEAVASGDGPSGAPGVPTDAVRYADERGVLVVAAAGNRRGAAASYPPESPIVLVGAVDREDRATSFSSVDRLDGFVAPGVDILSTWCRRTAGGCDVRAAPYGVAEGTSFAAPHVSAVAALLAAAGHDAASIRERLAAGAVDLGPPGPDPEHGSGRVDAAASLGAPPAAQPRSVPATTDAEPAGTAETSPAPPREPAAPAPTATSTDAAPGDDGDVGATVEVPSSDPEPVTVEPDGEGGADVPGVTDDDPPAAAEAPEPVAEDGAEPIARDAGGSDGAPGGGPAPAVWLQLVAAAALAVTMASWSAVARAAS